jgi:alpha-N-arabinofuranosidase
MIPQGWQPGTVDAIATGSADGKRIVIKAVNYQSSPNILLARLQGSSVPVNAQVKVYTVKAGLTDSPSLENPGRIEPAETTMPYARDLTINLDPYSVTVIEIVAQ